MCAKTRANTIKSAPCFAQFMVIASVVWCCVPHRFQLDKAKTWTCPWCVSSMENIKCSKTNGFVTFCWYALWSAKLEAQPSPTQMLRYHATSRQWFMQNVWQGQWKLMGDSLVYLHYGVWLASQYLNQHDRKCIFWKHSDEVVRQWHHTRRCLACWHHA